MCADALSGMGVSLTSDNASIRSELQDLRQGILELRGDFNQMQQRVMLGLMAHLVDDAAAEFVYGEDFSGHTSIRDLFSDVPLLSCDQQQRFQLLCLACPVRECL